MNRLFKKIMGVLIAAVFVVTAAGCADTGIALTIDGSELAAGEYIYSQFTALSSALAKFEEENPDLDTTVIGFDYYRYNVEGIPFRDWVVNETINIMARRQAYSKLFDELGLEFDAEELNEHKTAVSNAWNVEDSYLPYYGIEEKTWGAYYESVGISKASFQKVYEKDAKAEKVFHAYYDKGGEKEVSDDELWTKMKEDYARCRILTVELTDADGNELTDTAAISELEGLAEKYIERLNSGELFSVISEDYETFRKEQYREAHPEDYEEDEAIGNAEDNEEIGDEANGDTEETDEPSENDNDIIVSKTSTSPTEEAVAYVFSLEAGENGIFKTEDAYYVIMRLDITEREDKFEEYRETLLHVLKSDEMLTYIDEVAAALTLVKNQAALDRYEPKKLM